MARIDARIRQLERRRPSSDETGIMVRWVDMQTGMMHGITTPPATGPIDYRRGLVGMPELPEGPEE